jgi:ribonuclease HII
VLGALRDLKDSKQLTAEERSAAMEVIRAVAVAIGLGWSSHHVIDSLGIVAANRMAMVRAVRHLPIPPDALLVDHVSLRQCGLPQLYLSKADERSLSVAAASVVAKVVRDRWMTRCGARFPAYGFSQHKGYGTPAHRLALEVLGPSKVHRLSFQPVAAKVDAFS